MSTALPRRLAGWARRTFVDAERPLVAVEVRPTSIGVLRARREKGRLVVAAASSLDLPEGTLTPSLTQPNVADPARFQETLHGALERAGVLGGARIALVLPDTAARVSLVPAADLRGKKPAEADEMLRFKLRKSLPFEVRDARLGHALAGARATDTALAVALLAPVLAGYEDACRSVLLEPGHVEVCGLALARSAVEEGDPADHLIVNWDVGYLTLILIRAGWPLLVRTLGGAVVASQAEVAREVEHTLLYYRERLSGAGIERALVRSAAVTPAEAVAALQASVGVPLEILDAWPKLGGAPPAVAQALAGAAAALAVPA